MAAVELGALDLLLRAPGGADVLKTLTNIDAAAASTAAKVGAMPVRTPGVAQAAAAMNGLGAAATKASTAVASIGTRLSSAQANAVIAQRIALLERGLTLDATRAVSLAKLEGIEATLSTVVKRGNLAYTERIGAELLLQRVQSSVADAKRTAEVSRLTIALRAGNLTLRERITLYTQLRAATRAQRVAEGELASASIGTTGALGGLRSMLAGLVTTIGLVAFTRLTGELYELGTAGFETQSKFQTTFGDSTDAVQNFLDHFGRLAGLNKTVAQDFSSTAGAIVEGMGADQKAAADFSKRIIQLAGDLTSFHNVPIEESFQAIRSGLVGQSEPMMRFGVVIRQTDAQQRALIETGKTNVKQLNQLELAQARLNLMYERAGVAIGDLERTQSSASNRARQLQADYENLKISLGTGLLPVFAGTVTVLQKVVDFIGDHGPLILGLTAAVGVIGAGSLAMKLFTTTVVTATGTVPLLVRALSSLTALAVNPAVLAIGALAVVIGGIVYLQARARKEAEEYKKSLMLESDTVNSATRLHDEYVKLNAEIKSGKLKADELASARERLKTVTEELAKLSPDYKAALDKEGQSAEQTAASIKELTEKRLADLRTQKAAADAQVKNLQDLYDITLKNASAPGNRFGFEQLGSIQNQLDKAKAKADALKAAVDAATAPPKTTAKTDGSDDDPNAADLARRVAAAKLAAQIQAAQRSRDIHNSELQDDAQANEAAYANNLKSLDQYYAERTRITRAQTENEVKMLQRQRALVASRPVTDSEDEVKKKEEVADLDARILAARADGARQLAQLSQQQGQSDKELTQQLLQSQQMLAQARGEAHAAAMMDIDQQVQKYDELLVREGKLSDVQRKRATQELRDALENRQRLKEINDQLQHEQNDLSLRKEEIQKQIERGLISEKEGNTQIAQLERDRLPVLQRLAEQALLLATALKDPEAVDAINKLIAAFQDLGKEVDPNVENLKAAFDAVDDVFQHALTDVAGTFADGIAAAAEGTDTFGNVVAKGLGNIMVQMGKSLLVYGLTMMKLLPALSNPFTSGPAALIAGAALIALGASLRGAATGSGGGGGGGSSASASPPPDRTTNVTFVSGQGFVQNAPQRISPEPSMSGARVTPRSNADVKTIDQRQFQFNVIGDWGPKTEREVMRNIRSAEERGL